MAEQSPTARQNDRAQGGVPASDPFDPAALRARLEEARAQRERAIAARHGAAAAPAAAAGPRSVASSPPHSLPRLPAAEPPRPRFEAPPPSRVVPVAKPKPTQSEPLVALPGERPAPPRRTPRTGRRRLLPALAFLGGCLAAAAGVSLAPPSLRQQIAEFIAPSQMAPAPSADIADDVDMTNDGASVTAQVVVPAETPSAPPDLAMVTAENPAPPAAAEAPDPVLAPEAPESAPSAAATPPAPTPDLPPNGGQPPRAAIAWAQDLLLPRVPDARLASPAAEVSVADAGRAVEPPAASSIEPAPDRLPNVVRRSVPAPVQAEVAAAPVQANVAAPAEAPPAAAEAPPAPVSPFKEPTLALGEVPRPPAGPPLRVAAPAKRPPIEYPIPETLAALTPAQPAEPEAPAPATAGSARVLVHYPPSASAAAQAAAAALAGSGAAQAEVVPVQFTISRTNVRFYHPQDAGTAQALAAALSGADAGLSAETRDFTSFRPRPAPGTIEVWLAGGGPAPARTAARPTQPAPSASPPAAQRANPQPLAADERQRLERQIQGLLLRQLQELQRR